LGGLVVVGGGGGGGEVGVGGAGVGAAWIENPIDGGKFPQDDTSPAKKRERYHYWHDVAVLSFLPLCVH
jgi:hypothetical protein